MQSIGHLLQRLSGNVGLPGLFLCALSHFSDFSNLPRDGRGTYGCVGDMPANLRRRHRLLDRGVGDRFGYPAHVVHDRSDFCNQPDGQFGVLLDDFDPVVDAFCGRSRLLGELLHFGRDNHKGSSRGTGAGGLDRRIQRQHVGLPGDCVDDLHNRFDVLAGGSGFPDRVAG